VRLPCASVRAAPALPGQAPWCGLFNFDRNSISGRAISRSRVPGERGRGPAYATSRHPSRNAALWWGFESVQGAPRRCSGVTRGPRAWLRPRIVSGSGTLSRWARAGASRRVAPGAPTRAPVAAAPRICVHPRVGGAPWAFASAVGYPSSVEAARSAGMVLPAISARACSNAGTRSKVCGSTGQ
jgi:hypothetical protein